MPDWLTRELVEHLGWGFTAVIVIVTHFVRSRRDDQRDERREAWQKQIAEVHATLLNPLRPGDAPLSTQMREVHQFLTAQDADGATVSRIRQQHQEALEKLTVIGSVQARTMETQAQLLGRTTTMLEQITKMIDGMQQELAALAADKRAPRARRT